MPKGDTLVVHEIYASIQGETTFAGVPCTFIRTSGCNLRCTWCDTPQAFVAGDRRFRKDVLKEALAFGTPLVELTGGEPLLQEEAVLPLMVELCDAGKTVLIETSGERDISGIDPRVHRIVDLKAPGSGEHSKNRWANIEHLTRRDQVKFVVKDRADYEWSRERIIEHSIAARVHAVLLSPVWNDCDPKQLVDWLLEDKLEARVSLQIHKHIWGGEAEGV